MFAREKVKTLPERRRGTLAGTATAISSAVFAMSKIDQWRKHEPTPEHFKRMGMISSAKAGEVIIRCPR